MPCQMFFTLQPEWIFHNVNQIKPPNLHASCSLPKALCGFPWLRALSPAAQKRPCQGQLCLPLLLLYHFSLQCPDSGHISLLDFALLSLATSLFTSSIHSKKIPSHSLTLACPLDLRRAFPEILTGFSDPTICFPSSSSPSLVPYMLHGAGENIWSGSPLYLPPEPIVAWHIGLNTCGIHDWKWGKGRNWMTGQLAPSWALKGWLLWIPEPFFC